MSTVSKSLGKAMYVASQLDKSWLQNVQKTLYAQSWEKPVYVFQKLWGLVTDPRNLRIAVERVAHNQGRHTPGVDRLTVTMALVDGAERYVEALRSALRSGTYRPMPVRRVLIPKPGQPGKFRPLGIPTVNDRVVQAALKNILEPIFEADFFPTSHGFRPGHSAHGALEHLRVLLMPRQVNGKGLRCPYQWAVEGDIKGCFDNIDHHALMNRVRLRVSDPKVNRLIVGFLRSGVMSEGVYSRSTSGTPQGGILSPILANIALAVLDERYRRYAFPRLGPTPLTDRKKIVNRTCGFRGRDRAQKTVCVPIRYADDFIVLLSVPPGQNQMERALEEAHREKKELAESLRGSLGLELSESKSLVTPVTGPMRFLGFHIRVQNRLGRGYGVAISIPRDKSQLLRETIKRMFRRDTIWCSLDSRLRLLNQVLRGWGAYYRHAWRAKRVFASIDHYVWWTILRWLRKKHPKTAIRKCVRAHAWRRPGRRTIRWKGKKFIAFKLTSLTTGNFRSWWHTPPDYALTSAESPVQNESCPPGSGRGTRRPTRR